MCQPITTPKSSKLFWAQQANRSAQQALYSTFRWRRNRHTRLTRCFNLALPGQRLRQCPHPRHPTDAQRNHQAGQRVHVPLPQARKYSRQAVFQSSHPLPIPPRVVAHKPTADDLACLAALPPLCSRTSLVHNGLPIFGWEGFGVEPPNSRAPEPSFSLENTTTCVISRTYVGGRRSRPVTGTENLGIAQLGQALHLLTYIK